MTSIRNILVIGVALILILNGKSFAKTLYRPKRLNEFILRKCIASKKLIKTHLAERNKTRSIPSDAKHNINENATMHLINGLNRTTMIGNISKSANVKDTPLAILKDMSLIFQKKDLLPVLQYNAFNKSFEILLPLNHNHKRTFFFLP